MPALNNGLQELLRLLHRQHGAEDDMNVKGHLDQFFELKRGSLNLLEYINEHKFCSDEATRQNTFLGEAL